MLSLGVPRRVGAGRLFRASAGLGGAAFFEDWRAGFGAGSGAAGLRRIEP
jgi:hypothetical protein